LKQRHLEESAKKCYYLNKLETIDCGVEMKVSRISRNGTMRSTKQEGMTFLGIVLMFALFAIFALVGLKLFPLYYENIGVKQSLEGIQEEFKGNTGLTVSKMKFSLQNRLDTNDVKSIKAQDVKFKKGKGGYLVDASYSPKVNYVGNLNFVVDFEHKFELKK